MSLTCPSCGIAALRSQSQMHAMRSSEMRTMSPSTQGERAHYGTQSNSFCGPRANGIRRSLTTSESAAPEATESSDEWLVISHWRYWLTRHSQEIMLENSFVHLRGLRGKCCD